MTLNITGSKATSCFQERCTAGTVLYTPPRY
jgi:hypothetical protein